ncbi:STAS domain-containing protein [Kineococcus sp. SYSU DK005]|uniref:STAS domain-containing protein n=1 Tax=Kineococcus sp. SYSU DK005 TaxID=3383126 RepID=UPI003D7D790E
MPALPLNTRFPLTPAARGPHPADADEAQLHLALDDGPGPRCAHLRARGELEASTAHLLLDAVDGSVRRGRHDLELDLADVVFCDVRGIDAVLTARVRLRAAGGELHLQGVRPFLHHVLRVLHLDEVVAG